MKELLNQQRKMLVRAVVVALLVLVVQAVNAQGNDNEPSLEEEDIIVRAKKRLQNESIGSTVLSKEEIEDANLDSISDLAERTLGITFSEGGGIMVRGTGGGGRAVGSIGGVTTIVDGEVLDRGINLELLEPVRIEILRGIQATRAAINNGPSGSIRSTSTRPSLNKDMNGYIRYEVTEPEDYNVKAAVGASISDRAAYRLNGYYKNSAGWLENTYPGNPNGGKGEDYGFRGQLIMSPAEDWKVIVRAEYSDRHYNNPGPVVTQADNPNNKFFTLTGQKYGKNVDSNTMDKNQFSEKNDWGISTEITKLVGDFKLIYKRFYRDSESRSNSDPDDNAVLLANATFQSLYNQKSSQHGFHIASPKYKKYDYVTDFFYHHVENRRSGLNERCGNGFESDRADRIAVVDIKTLKVTSCDGTKAGGPDAYPWNREDSTNTIYTVDDLAVSSHFNYHVSPDLRVFVGGRLSSRKTELEYAGGFGKVSSFRGRGSTGGNIFTYKYGGYYKVTDHFKVYTSYGIGYKHGGIYNIHNATRKTLENPVGPEKSKAYEVGFHSEWIGGKLLWNTTVFLTDYEDFQQRIKVQDEDNEFEFIDSTINGGAYSG